MMKKDLEMYPDRVSEFFSKKTIFITGGTGFLGKVLIEKLLRACSDLQTIYVLVRSKRGKTGQERLNNLFQAKLYDKIREDHGEEIFKKVVPINGDIQFLNLGLSPEDQQLLTQEVEVIYHSAATVRFDETLKNAVILNVRGTRELLKLAKNCSKLLVFNHVSTGFCQIKEDVIYERFYPPPADPHQLISTCEWMSEEALNAVTKEIIGTYPNTYTFTKALAEDLIAKEVPNLPLIVTRPTIVVPIWKEPIPGWTDSMNGPMGLLVAGGKGVLWSVLLQGKACSDHLPVDTCANGLICSSVDYVINKSERRVFNFATSNAHKYSLDKIINTCKKVCHTIYPPGSGIWHAGSVTTTCRPNYYLQTFFLQIIPALLVDLILTIMGKRTIMIPIQKKLYRGQSALRYFLDRKWYWDINNVREAVATMNPREISVYGMNDEDFDLYEYVCTLALSTRRYILKRPDDTLAGDLRIASILLFMDKVIVVVFLYFLFRYFFL